MGLFGFLWVCFGFLGFFAVFLFSLFFSFFRRSFIYFLCDRVAPLCVF